MQSGGAITIYHLSRRDGTALFIHPLMKPGSMLELSREVELVGTYGEEPRVESVTMLRNELYRRIEEDVRDWINERRFIPRFLIAAGVFLVIYLFLAMVIRDPLPVLDETLVGLAVAVFTFVVIGRRFEQSKVASQRRVQLRTKVDGVVFSEDAFVHAAEDLLRNLEAREPTATELGDEVRRAASDLQERFPEKSAELVRHLRHMMGVKDYRKLSRAMRRGSLNASLRDQIEQGVLVPAAVHLLNALNPTLS